MKYAAILLILALTAGLPAYAQESPDDTRKTDLEARLAAAREQLAVAAAKVAELSRELGGQGFAYHYTTAENRGVLGLALTRDGEDLVVASVAAGSAAAEAGVEVGDTIVAVNDEPVNNSGANHDKEYRLGGDDLPSGLQGLAPGETVTLTLTGESGTREVSITAQPRASFGWFPNPGTPDIGAFRMPEIEIESLRELGELRPVLKSFRLPLMDRRWSELELVSLSPELGSYFETGQGVLVVSVPPDNALRLEPGDVILKIGGRRPNNPAHAFRILRSYGEGETIAVRVVRHGKEVTLEHRMQE